MHMRLRAPTRPATLTTALATVAVSVAGLTSPAVLEALQRRPGELGEFQPWRLLTSVLVHDSWIALASNTVALLIIGAAAERAVRPTTWAGLYLLGGVTGQLAGVAWQPTGAGNSVATLGLLGGIGVLALRGRDDGVPALAFGVLWLLAVLATHVAEPVAIALVIVAAAGAAPLARRWVARGDPPRPAPALAVATLIAALALTTMRDIHGPALLVATAAATGLRP